MAGAGGSDASFRRALVAGNWKMHHDHLATLHFLRDLGFRLDPADLEVVDVAIHPPFTDLRTAQSVIEDRSLPVDLGAQHCSEHDEGPYTGEVSPAMLARLGVRYVIVGHSERRRLYAMADHTVAATVRAVLRHAMVPILCVGESLEQRQEGGTEDHLRVQLTEALEGLASDVVKGLVVAYEPLWAIGTGQAATPEDAQAACRFVRRVVADMVGDHAAADLRVQYGGSVNADNTAALMAQPDVDGLLVGGASLEAQAFGDIVRSAAACYRSLVAARHR